MWDTLRILDEPPKSDGAPTAAVLAAIYPDGAELRLILTKRPMTMPTHAGHLAFPGGRPDPSDTGPIDTALREAHEEVGLHPEAVEVVGFLPPIHTFEYSLFVVPVVGRLSEVPALMPSEREVDKILTPTLTDLRDQARWKYELWNDRRVWFFDIEGEVLWGATAWMTRQMLGLDDG